MKSCLLLENPAEMSPFLPGVGPQISLTMAYVTSYSKHKEAALEAAAFMTGDEFQMNVSRKAFALPVSSSPDVKNAFGQDASNPQGKNVRTLLNNKQALPFAESQYSRAAAQVYEKTM